MESSKKKIEKKSKTSEQIGVILTRLDQFALQTALPRPWHVEWQMLLTRVTLDIQKILDQKDPDDA